MGNNIPCSKNWIICFNTSSSPIRILIPSVFNRPSCINPVFSISNIYSGFEIVIKGQIYNFIGYCKTDFARFCLSLYKNGPNLLTGGGLENIPWLDFTQEWDDQKLYEFFDVNEETQEYIENFLPDYYGIRNKTKEIE